MIGSRLARSSWRGCGSSAGSCLRVPSRLNHSTAPRSRSSVTLTVSDRSARANAEGGRRRSGLRRRRPTISPWSSARLVDLFNTDLGSPGAHGVCHGEPMNGNKRQSHSGKPVAYAEGAGDRELVSPCRPSPRETLGKCRTSRTSEDWSGRAGTDSEGASSPRRRGRQRRPGRSCRWAAS